MSIHIIDDTPVTDGEWVKFCAEDELPRDHRCQCGRLIFGGGLACEICDPESIPALLREQAA